MSLAQSVGYRPEAGRRDEAVSESGEVSPEWLELFDSVHRHGETVLSDWSAVAARLSWERGLAYQPASVEGGEDEGWSLDPIPAIISQEGWGHIEPGLSQRTRLFDAILRDVYGEQRMLRERLVPAEILLGHTGFLRCLHDLVPGDRTIGVGLSAYDIACDASGQLFVVNDRFDCPFGLGLALENRTIVNQVLPRLFRRCGVRRIGQFFTDWFDYLLRRAPDGTDRPVVVILDASGNSEISFLANYCGILRVHPSDLTVRGGRVWIKALKGLVPVDVIWKTMPGREIDSLESEVAHAPGIAGLFEVMRVGGVALASHPGSEVLQSPGFYPYLHELCRAFLGEDLQIPPVATWWCGDPEACSHVLANLSTLVIKSVGHHRSFRTRYGSRLSEGERAELRTLIEANPGGFVGQEELLISTTPTTRHGNLEPRGAVLRMFSYLDDEKGPRVMPGGLGRVGTAEGMVVSTRGRGESKDVWVRSFGEEEPYSIASVVSRSLPSPPDIVPSRTGENLFWTGRYAERVQLVARFAARIIDGRSRGYSLDPEFERTHEDLTVAALHQVFEYAPAKPKEGETPETLGPLLLDPDCPVGIPFNLSRFHIATQSTREAWSRASILAIESCVEGWRAGAERLDPHFGNAEELDKLQLHLNAFLGLNLDSMTRDEKWALLDAGRRVERISVICGLLAFLLEAKVKGELGTLFNETVLYLLDSVRTYQAEYHATPETARTTRLLLGEDSYPRSILFLLTRLDEVARWLPDPSSHSHPRLRIERIIGELRAWCENLGAEIEEDRFNRRKALEFVRRLKDNVAEFSDQLTVAYFSHTVED